MREEKNARNEPEITLKIRQHQCVGICGTERLVFADVWESKAVIDVGVKQTRVANVSGK